MKAGDTRVNEVPNLSLLHTIFMREHNRIAENIARSEGGSDEQIFQVYLQQLHLKNLEIVIGAKIKHIVFIFRRLEEFLLLNISIWSTMNGFQLFLDNSI